MKPLVRFTTATAVLILALGLMPSLTGPASAKTANYGEKVRYQQAREIVFPHFRIVYDGKRRVSPAQYAPGWWAYDFTVKSGTFQQMVSWSAGTGDIGPVIFTVRGKKFALERSRSDRLGRLRDDEIVVTPFRD